MGLQDGQPNTHCCTCEPRRSLVVEAERLTRSACNKIMRNNKKSMNNNDNNDNLNNKINICMSVHIRQPLNIYIYIYKSTEKRVIATE